ncbi:MAG: response regulator [Fibrobacterota bacterium]
MFGNLKVGTRLTLSFMVILAIMAGIIAAGMSGIRGMNDETRAIVEYENTRTALVNDMVDASREMNILVGNLLAESYRHVPGAIMADRRQRLEQLHAEYARTQEEFRKLVYVQDTVGTVLLAKVVDCGIAAEALQDEVVRLTIAGKIDSASVLWTQNGEALSRAWIAITDTLVKNEDHRTLVRFEHAQGVYERTGRTLLLLGALATLLALGIIVVLTKGITRPLGLSIDAANRIASGDLDIDLSKAGNRRDEIGSLLRAFSQMILVLRDAANQAEVVSRGDYSTDFVVRSQKDGLGLALQKMTLALRENRDSVQKQDWLKTGAARLGEVMGGNQDVAGLASKVITEFTTYLGAQIGAFYVVQEREGVSLALMGSYAYTRRKGLSNVFGIGEGLVGQAALEKKPILVSDIPDDYIHVTSGLGDRIPRFICVAPFLHEGRVKGVIEVGSFDAFDDRQLEYLQQAMSAVGLAVESAEGRSRLAKSLEESNALAELLQAQQEELRATNEELQEQTTALRAAEEKLKVQQEELQVTNEELEEKNQLLDQQKRDVEKARKDIENKAAELASASKYKSEFLANMSHELRTPLNSLLLLSQSLSENKKGNLTPEQVQSAKIILGSGSDLLALINEILDLSKIEAGRMELQLAPIVVAEFAASVRESFVHMTDEKGLELRVVVDDHAPSEFVSDRRRLDQVVRNLMSNAIKFTETGSVTLTVSTRGAAQPQGGATRPRLAIEVRDTGIGIAPEHRNLVFEAFQQVDGGTARRYGGTGLGLSISRELAKLLGGEISLESQIGEGSSFTLLIPLAPSSQKLSTPVPARIRPRQPSPVVHEPASSPDEPDLRQIEDDQPNLQVGDRTILVIEDDSVFAKILLEKCHEKGFKCVSAPTGELGLELARKHNPEAVLLDLGLPGMDGWSVLEALKEDPATRHIPVHIASAEDASPEALRKGAIGQTTKPITQSDIDGAFEKIRRATSREPRRVLVVEDDPTIRDQTSRLIADNEVSVDGVGTGKEAMELLRGGGYDCVVLDLRLPDMNGADLLERLSTEGVEIPPVIVHTARDLTREEESRLREHTESIVIKDARSQERLLDEVSLFLHQVVGQMPERKRKMITDLHDADALLRDKVVLIVDDDMRTTFALSHHLSERGVKTLKAENGERALKVLEENPNVDLVLMDIMMPVVDGYEAMKRIRAIERFRKLPILALTAKAMPEDREKCLAAGANDYLRKPIDPNRLASMMRVWLYR